MKETFDPKLKECAKELMAVMRKHDVMGTVVLASPTHSEWVMHVDASWSVAKFEGEGIRFRSKKEDFPNKAAQDFATESTVHGIESMRWLNAKIHDQLGTLVDMLRKKMVIATNVGAFFKEPEVKYPTRDKITQSQVQALGQAIGGVGAMIAGLGEVDLSLGRRSNKKNHWSLWTRAGHKIDIELCSDGGLIASKSKQPDPDRPAEPA